MLPVDNYTVIGCVTAMKMRLRTLLRTQRAQADAVASYANGSYASGKQGSPNGQGRRN
jgi:hypothetical protein